MWFTFDVDGYFIHEPLVTNRLGLRTQTFLIDPTELTTPASNRFSAYFNASLRQQVLYIAKTKTEFEMGPHSELNGIDENRWRL